MNSLQFRRCRRRICVRKRTGYIVVALHVHIRGLCVDDTSLPFLLFAQYSQMYDPPHPQTKKGVNVFPTHVY
jgi:hypothetical protein